MAECYKHSTGVAKDLRKAAQAYATASAEGYQTGWVNLLVLLNSGRFCERMPSPPASPQHCKNTVKDQGMVKLESCVRPISDTIVVSETIIDHQQIYPIIPSTGITLMASHNTFEQPVNMKITSQQEGNNGIGNEAKRKEAEQIQGKEQKEEEAKKNKPEEIRWGEYCVPRLYDICCTYYQRQFVRMPKDARQAEMAKLPLDIIERISMGSIACTRFDCRKMIYGSGRVQRRFYLKKEKNNKNRNNSIIKVDPRLGNGGVNEEDDVLLAFCSVACSNATSMELSHCRRTKPGFPIIEEVD